MHPVGRNRNGDGRRKEPPARIAERSRHREEGKALRKSCSMLCIGTDPHSVVTRNADKRNTGGKVCVIEMLCNAGGGEGKHAGIRQCECRRENGKRRQGRGQIPTDAENRGGIEQELNSGGCLRAYREAGIIHLASLHEGRAIEREVRTRRAGSELELCLKKGVRREDTERRGHSCPTVDEIPLHACRVVRFCHVRSSKKCILSSKSKYRSAFFVVRDTLSYHYNTLVIRKSQAK